MPNLIATGQKVVQKIASVVDKLVAVEKGLRVCPKMCLYS
jgi:hypothetical protein